MLCSFRHRARQECDIPHLHNSAPMPRFAAAIRDSQNANEIQTRHCSQTPTTWTQLPKSAGEIGDQAVESGRVGCPVWRDPIPACLLPPWRVLGISQWKPSAFQMICDLKYAGIKQILQTLGCRTWLDLIQACAVLVKFVSNMKSKKIAGVFGMPWTTSILSDYMVTSKPDHGGSQGHMPSNSKLTSDQVKGRSRGGSTQCAQFQMAVAGVAGVAGVA